MRGATMIDVNIEQVREAFPLLANTEQKRVVLQMADEIERLRSEVAELKRQSDNANNYIQSLKR